MLGWFSMNQFRHKLPFYSTIKNLFTNSWLFFLNRVCNFINTGHSLTWCCSLSLYSWDLCDSKSDNGCVWCADPSLPGQCWDGTCLPLRLLELPKGHPVIFAFNRCCDKSLTWGRQSCRQKHPQNYITFHFPGGRHPDVTYVFIPA